MTQKFTKKNNNKVKQERLTKYILNSVMCAAVAYAKRFQFLF